MFFHLVFKAFIPSCEYFWCSFARHLVYCIHIIQTCFYLITIRTTPFQFRIKAKVISTFIVFEALNKTSNSFHRLIISIRESNEPNDASITRRHWSIRIQSRLLMKSEVCRFLKKKMSDVGDCIIFIWFPLNLQTK